MAVIAGLLVILFLFRPGVQRLRNRIATSIGSALGRRVAIDDVRFRASAAGRGLIWKGSSSTTIPPSALSR